MSVAEMEIPSPRDVHDLYIGLLHRRQTLQEQHRDKSLLLEQLRAYLKLSPDVEAALESLGDALFKKLADTLKETLTFALQEVLGQSIELEVEQNFKNSAATLKFWIRRNGEREDIMRGQGGSVANILSVGLRLFALHMAPEKLHRRFLVLDEQDCWLAPDLVPRLIKIIHAASKELGFQVLIISHHDISSFDQHADRIYRFEPTPNGVHARLMQSQAKVLVEGDQDY